MPDYITHQIDIYSDDSDKEHFDEENSNEGNPHEESLDEEN